MIHIKKPFFFLFISLLTISSTFGSLRPTPITEVIGEMPDSESEILKLYHDKNGDPIPLVFRGAAKNWEVASWTPENFAERFGDKKIMTLPQKILEDGLDYDEKSKTSIENCIHTTVKDHINNILKNPKDCGYFLGILPYETTREKLEGGDVFLKNGIFVNDYLDLPNQTLFPQSVIKADPKEMRSYAVFIGSGNSVTSLHSHGSTFLAQVYGEKSAKLIHPKDTEKCYCKRVIRENFAQSCAIDIEAPNFEKYPELKDLEVFETVLNPGDVLYIPDHWLHDVRSLSTSISVASGF